MILSEQETITLHATNERHHGLNYTDASKLLAAYEHRGTRNTNLSRVARIAENTATQQAIPLRHIRELTSQLEAGTVDAEKFIAGVCYWAQA